MKCTHKITRKLFWLDQNKGKWMTTNYSICIECGVVVGMKEIKNGK